MARSVCKSNIASPKRVADKRDAGCQSVKLLPAEATDAEILAACREWIALVAAGLFTEAVEMLHVPDRYDESQRWTTESLQKYVGNYGSWDEWADGRTWKVTAISTARVPSDRPNFYPRADLIRYDADPHSGSAELDLPLNGEWSDLTAQFEFEPVGEGTGLSLYDLHVL